MVQSPRLLSPIALVAALLLAGCGTDPAARTQGGGAAGAATGATIGLLGGPIGVVGGALIGGGVGALTGSFTKPSQVNLGGPLWSSR